MGDSMRKQVVMEKQEYIPIPARKEPLYQLESVSDLGISPLYKVRVDGEDIDVYGNEFFHFATVVYRERGWMQEVEVTIPDDAESVRLRPSSAGLSFERDGSVLRFRIAAGQRVIVELDDDPLCPLYLLQSEKIEKPEHTSYEFRKGRAYNIDTVIYRNICQKGDIKQDHQG